MKIAVAPRGVGGGRLNESSAYFGAAFFKISGRETPP
jgi:hypothetical protein